MKKLTEENVKFSVECHPEDVTVRGNCSSIDPVTDAEAEKWILDQLESGNQWAWCAVRVTATLLYRDGRKSNITGENWIGCCSYFGASDFCKPGGYWDDMKLEALADLQSKVDQLEGVIN